MQDVSTTSSRRSLVGRGLALALGAVGIGADGAAAARAQSPSTTQLDLYGRGLHLRAGDRHTAYGELLDRSRKAVGHFTAAHLAVDSPFAAAASLEIHTFNLADGTIHGLGSVTRGATGTFVVLGGTGRFAGASGSYTARQGTHELGGDGSAEFHFTLARPEGRNGS
jgi:hypothetical protein